MKNDKYPRESLDDAARRFTNGHYVVQSMPGPNPERDKLISEAITKLKQERTGVMANKAGLFICG
jgi:hypothetical protein